jgi:hypothetical protein
LDGVHPGAIRAEDMVRFRSLDPGEAAAADGRLRYTGDMPLLPTILNALAHLSRVCGFDTLDAFPPSHVHARTSWNRAYFDVASDLSGEQIERSLCESITNTPLIFAHITHPTPRMQRVLLSVIETRMRRANVAPTDLVKLLIDAYDSGATMEALAGLRATITTTRALSADAQIAAVLAFLGQSPSTFDLIEAPPAARLAPPNARATP